MKTIYFTQRTAARVFAAISLLSLVVGLVPVQALANHDPFTGAAQTNVTVCHTNNGNGAGFTANTVAVSSSGAPRGGHDANSGVHATDIIPPYHYLDGDEILQSYPGKNWNTTNQAIWNNNCNVPQPAPAATLTLVKAITGGTASLSSWTLSASGPTNISGASGATSVTNATVTPGSYTLSESGNVANYTNGTTYSCVKNGGTAVSSNNLTLANADTVICTITNTYVAPPRTGTITLQKTVINDNGGLANASNFTFRIDGNTVALNTPIAISPGAHTVSEDAFANYTAGAWGTNCGTNGSITVTAGQNYTCTITNNDNQVVTPTGTLNVVKVIVGNPSATAVDFTYTLNANPAVAFAVNGTPYTLAAGSLYTVSEVVDTKYTTTPVGCSGTIVANQPATCTITNTWIPTCFDLIKNQGETDVDTGGVCGGGGGGDPILGCTHSTATNYNAHATLGNSQADMCDYNYVSQCGDTPNLLLNGSFEDPVIAGPWSASLVTNWVITKVIDGTATLSEIWRGLSPSSNLAQHLELDGTTPVKITQTVATISGATYELRFDFAARSGTDASNNSVKAMADTTTVVNQSTANTNWTTYGGTFVADASTDVSLADMGVADGYGTLVDNAVLCLVRLPEPAPVCKVEVVSDTSNMVNESGALIVGAPQPGPWVDNIVGSVAQWIWGSPAGSAIDPVNNESQTFKKTFVWNGPVTSAVLKISADNFYSVKLNGVELASTTDEFNYSSTDMIDLSAAIVQGTNTLEITATNLANGETILDSNPAGLLYDLTVSGNTETDCTLAPVETLNGGGGGGGHGGGHRKTPAGDVLGAATSSPEVLGDQVSAVPTGAPNAGAGSTSPFSLGFVSVAPVAFLRRARIHG